MIKYCIFFSFVRSVACNELQIVTALVSKQLYSATALVSQDSTHSGLYNLRSKYLTGQPENAFT